MTYPEKYLEIAKQIVLKHIPKDEYAVFLFGSRVKNKNRRYADIDIGVLGKKEFDRKIKSAIEDVLEESIVPYEVQLIDFHKADLVFRKIALESIEIWRSPKHIKIR